MKLRDILAANGGKLPPLAGGTTPANLNLVFATPKFPKNLPVTTDQTINQGDMVWWDAVNGTLKPLTKRSQVEFVAGTGGFCGISNDTSAINIYGTENLASLGVTRLGAVALKCTAGEFYKDFQEVTINETGTGDSQTVSLVSVTSSNRVGFVIAEPPVTALGAQASTPTAERIVGEGQRVMVWLEPKFPTTVCI